MVLNLAKMKHTLPIKTPEAYDWEYENETTKQAGEAEVKVVLSFGNGNYSKPFCTDNPDKAKRIYNAKEYFEVK